MGDSALGSAATWSVIWSINNLVTAACASPPPGQCLWPAEKFQPVLASEPLGLVHRGGGVAADPADEGSIKNAMKVIVATIRAQRPDQSLS